MELSFKRWSATKSGKQSTIKVVLLHGMGGTGALWRPVAAGLEENYDILAPDQRGHGQSRPQKPASYTPLEYGKDLIETLDSIDFHPAWIVGHSMGVRTACAAAHLKAEWVQGLVLVDLGFSGAAGGGLGDGLAHFLRILPETFGTREEARAFMDKECPDPSIAQYLMAVSVKLPDGRQGFPFDRAALIETIEEARESSVGTWIRELGARGMPVLILRGANSLVWTHEEFEKEKNQYKDLPTVFFEEISGAGHGLPFERRTLFIDKLKQFIQSHSNSVGSSCRCPRH